MASDSTYDVFQHYGTDAERLAFTPSPAAGIQPIYIWSTTDTGIVWLYDTSWHAISAASGVLPYSGIVQGRLTTESGVPVSASDRTAQGTLYYTPAIDGLAITTGQIALYTGAAVAIVSFTQLSLALSLTSGKNYDVFVDYNSGTPQLVLSAAWTNDTTRADALGVQSGLIVKSGTATYRWVGTIRASGANVTADAAAARFVWNAYNQVPMSLANPTETTNTWSYTTNTIRQANANTANKFEYVTGDATTVIDATLLAMIASKTNSAQGARSGIGIDSITAFTGLQSQVFNDGTAIVTWPASTRYVGSPGLGYHYVSWLEAGGDTFCVFLGDDGGKAQSGMVGSRLG